MTKLSLPILKTSSGTIANGCSKLTHLETNVENNSGTIAYNCSALKTLSLPKLKTSSGTIANGCSNLTQLEIQPDLKNTGTIIYGNIINNAELELPIIENNGTIINQCSTIKKLSLPNLKTSTGTIANGCSNLTVLELPNIQGDCGVIVNGTNKISSIYIPNITRFTGGTMIQSTEIEELNVPNLQSYTQSFHIRAITDCTTIKRIYAPKLNISTYHSIFLNCPNMEECYVNSTTSLQNIGYEGNTFSNLKKLKTLVCGYIFINHYNESNRTIFNGCDRLIHLEICLKQNSSIDIPYYTPSDAMNKNAFDLVENTDVCANNLEQFLYNFRKYIIDAVNNRISTSKLTITLSELTYNILLGLDETSYASTFHMPNEDIDYVTSLNQKLSEINWGLAHI